MYVCMYAAALVLLAKSIAYQPLFYFYDVNVSAELKEAYADHDDAINGT